jgi:hypothetical protein
VQAAGAGNFHVISSDGVLVHPVNWRCHDTPAAGTSCRELAQQVAGVARKLRPATGLRTAAVTGGVERKLQVQCNTVVMVTRDPDPKHRVYTVTYKTLA